MLSCHNAEYYYPNAIMLCHCAQYCYAEWHYAGYRDPELTGDAYSYAECRYTDCLVPQNS
jgi:hypothetical protein